MKKYLTLFVGGLAGLSLMAATCNKPAQPTRNDGSTGNTTGSTSGQTTGSTTGTTIRETGDLTVIVNYSTIAGQPVPGAMVGVALSYDSADNEQFITQAKTAAVTGSVKFPNLKPHKYYVLGVKDSGGAQLRSPFPKEATVKRNDLTTATIFVN